MKLDIGCNPEAREHIRILSYGMGKNEEGFGLGEDSEIAAELIYGKFEGEENYYFNLSFPQDYELNPNLPYFNIGNIRITVRDDKIAESIMSKKLVLKNNELEFV